jgi:hypothetical protein
MPPPEPEYVEYGSLATVPGPLRCLGSTQWGFLAEADHDRLDALCRRVFAEPSGGEVDLRPLGSHVLITLGRIERIVSEVAPFERMGSSPEGQAAVWIPVGRVRPEDFLLFTPYMWVDNPISLPSGREMYGFAKAFGWMQLPEGDAAPLGLDVFGMDFDRNETPSRRPLLRMDPGDRVDLAEIAWSGLLDLARHLRRPVEAHAELHLAETILDEVRKDRVRQAFLLQVRSPEDGRRAALQQVTEVAYRVSRFSGRPLGREYRLTVSPLDSHPLGAELGLVDQTIRYGFRTESDFVVEAGRVLWDAGSVRSPR